MSQFIARIELYLANDRDYELLNSKMLAGGFMNFIRADNGVDYLLPKAEFVITGSYSLKQVFDKAERATRGMRRESAILIIESRAITFKLREIK